MGKQSKEKGFEEAIETHLLDNGWHKGDPKTYSVALGFDTAEVHRFVTKSQPDQWAKLADHLGSEAKAEFEFCRRLAAELDARGTIDVLRRGIELKNLPFDLSFPMPGHKATPEPWDLYEHNRVAMTRQVHHSESKPMDSIDCLLFFNGLPVATAELKNQPTGQGVKIAQDQYEKDRNPNDLLFRARALVHFAVDHDLVYMTTRLAKAETYWLPFNQGSGGAGRIGGIGNPANPDGHRTAYLWEQSWQRENWINILLNFVHEDGSSGARTKNPRRVIFPRFHQWHAVSELVADAKAYGPGRNYLAQHSAGSGKSNTIAWLANALASLHTPDSEATLGAGALKVGLGRNQPVFNKVVIVTDRVALDRQLQKTVTSFDHTPGTIQQIDQNAAQLREALASAKARIIITTIQKFPVIAEVANELKGTRFAVIVDEAHSSQSGEAAKDLKAVLSGLSSDAALEAAEKAEGEYPDPQDALVRNIQARGKQDNLSFFAFTATPKQKTLDLFGTHRPDPNKPGETRLEPFHLYSMRQAVEEKFIEDVLANYLTYGTYYRLANAKGSDPEVDEAKAKAALARFASLHPSAFSQKAEIIVEHFIAHTSHKMRRRAKAMVVARSRLHALRMKQAIDAYVAKNRYKGLATLVAFSDGIIDPENPADPLDLDKKWTEAGVNGFPESQLPNKFATDEYQVLVVAEKYQTGFDQPLLHTMYVDKKLDGVKAVQTLSRLNRTHPDKEDTFVLDFVNTADDMAHAFKPFWERTWAEPTDPDLLSNLKSRLMLSGVLDPEEMDATVNAFLVDDSKTSGAINAGTALAVDRYIRLDSDDDREDFRTALRDYTRLYAFLSHIMAFNSVDHERLYIYGRLLMAYLPSSKEDPIPDLNGAADLTHLRFEKGSVESASLVTVTDDESEVTGHQTGGRGKEYDSTIGRLSDVIHVLNDRFGLNLTEADQLFFEQAEEAAMEDRKVQAVVEGGNDETQFRAFFAKQLEKVMLDRHSSNDLLLAMFLDKPEFREFMTDELGSRVYERLRSKSVGGGK